MVVPKGKDEASGFNRRWIRNRLLRGGESGTESENVGDEYAVERPVRYKRGAVLLWRYEVYHRGSAMLPGGLRVMHAFGFRRKDTPWHMGWHTAFAREAARMDASWMAALLPAQRSIMVSNPHQILRILTSSSPHPHNPHPILTQSHHRAFHRQRRGTGQRKLLRS